jgi:hypothetical protein
VTQPRVPGLDPAIQARAGLTDKEAEALALWDPGPIVEAIDRAGTFLDVGC